MRRARVSHHPARGEKREREGKALATEEHKARQTTMDPMTTPRFDLSKLPAPHDLDDAAAARVQRRKETAAHLLDTATQLHQAIRRTEELTKEYERAWAQATHDAWEPSELSSQGFPAPEPKESKSGKRPTTPARRAAPPKQKDLATLVEEHARQPGDPLFTN